MPQPEILVHAWLVCDNLSTVANENARKKPIPTRSPSRKNARSTRASSRLDRRTKVGPRVRTRGNSRREVGSVREVRPLSRLLEALEREKIRFILIGMSAAITQGVMGSTLDVDLWIDLPTRDYMRVMNLSLAIGGKMGANTVVFLEDGTPVNFVFKVTGLGTFSNELRHTLRISFLGRKIAVLSLERISKSKRAIGRDKDKLHLLQIAEFLRCKNAIRPQKGR